MQWGDCSLFADAPLAGFLYYRGKTVTRLRSSQCIMPSQPDYYATLEVSPTASPEVITSAYRSLARKYHPDANPSPEANTKMKAINAAYDVLGDRNKRAGYDRQRAAATAPQAPPSPPPSPAPAPPSQADVPPTVEPTLFQRIVGWVTSPAAGVFVIAFVIAYVALAFITDVIAPFVSDDDLALLAVLLAAAATYIIRRAPRR